MAVWSCVNVSVKRNRTEPGLDLFLWRSAVVQLLLHTPDCPLFVCVQCVTVSTECVIKVLMVMDSVCVNHRTPGDAVTKVRREKLDFPGLDKADLSDNQHYENYLEKDTITLKNTLILKSR